MTAAASVPDMDRYPAIQRHAAAWCALGRARLAQPLRPSTEYEARLSALMVAFMATRTVPSVEEFEAVIDQCLAGLRDRVYGPGITDSPEHRAALLAAGYWLKLAWDLACDAL